MPVDELIVDFALGWAWPAALFLGVIVFRNILFLLYAGTLTPVAYVTLGNLRGASEGNLWLKAICLSGAMLFLAASGGKWFLVAAGLSFVPAVLGLWLRRRGRLIWRRSAASDSHG